MTIISAAIVLLLILDPFGNLVTINNAAEYAWLQETFGTNRSLWIGLNDVQKEGEFAWASGEAVTYTNQGEIIRTMITALSKDDSTEIHATADVTLKEWGLLKNITTVDEWNEQIAALPPLDAICPDN